MLILILQMVNTKRVLYYHHSRMFLSPAKHLGKYQFLIANFSLIPVGTAAISLKPTASKVILRWVGDASLLDQVYLKRSG